MTMKLYSEESIQAIANAIREKNGSSDTYKVGEMATAITNIPSGGASNAVYGEFQAGSAGEKQYINLDYEGTGYPVACYFFPKGGFDSESNGIGTATNVQYAFVDFMASKKDFSISPTYSESNDDISIYTFRYKSAAASATDMDTTTALRGYMFGQSLKGTSEKAVMFKSSNVLGIFIANKGYGFIPGGHYQYMILYSN